jgi:integrase/recombinase XerD
MPLKLAKRKNSPFWWIRGTVCGTSINKSSRLTDRKLAEAMRKRLQTEIETASAYGTVEKTFNDACEAYLGWGGSDRFLDPLRKKLGDTKLSRIDQPTLDALARELHPTAQPSTLNRQVYTPFIAAWNYAAENDWARVRKWRRPTRKRGTVQSANPRRAGSKPVDYATAAEFIAEMSPAPAMLMTFLLYTGLRPIEALSLAAPDINLTERWITLRTSKTGEPRGVPLHDFLCEWLPDLVERGGILFRTTKGEPYTLTKNAGGQTKSAFMGARRRSGIDGVSLYTARHSCSTQLVIAGVHQHIKDQILGHAVDDMSRYYTNVPQAPLIEAINKLPVPERLRSLPWVASPKLWWGRLVEGTGRRTDLGR